MLQADMAASEIEQCGARIAREVAAWKAIDEFYKSKGRIDPYPCPDETIMVPGFVGKPKGIKQILWERGLWRPGMVRSKSKAEIKRIRLQDGVPIADDMYAGRLHESCHESAGCAWSGVQKHNTQSIGWHGRALPRSRACVRV